MCIPHQPVSDRLSVDATSSSSRLEKVRAARRIVKKYRRRQERQEMNKLRRLLPQGDKLRRRQVIDETISLIVALEQQLLAKMERQGRVPALLAAEGLQHHNLSLQKLRYAMAHLVPVASEGELVQPNSCHQEQVNYCV